MPGITNMDVESAHKYRILPERDKPYYLQGYAVGYLYLSGLVRQHGEALPDQLYTELGIGRGDFDARHRIPISDNPYGESTGIVIGGIVDAFLRYKLTSEEVVYKHQEVAS